MSSGKPIEDVEKASESPSSVGERSMSAPSASPGDSNIVTWDGPDDPENPKNWPKWRKALLTATLTTMAFEMPLGSSIIAPAVPLIQADLNNHSEILAGFIVSIFVLGFALGPIFFGPASEIWGRFIIYNVCNVLAVAMTVGCALSHSMSSLLAFRFLTGCFGAVPLAVGGGTIADITQPDERAKFVALLSIGPILGPMLGPVIGGFLSSNAGWRWCFWLMVILSGTVTVLAFFFLKETFGPTILARKAARLRKSTGNHALRISDDHHEAKGNRFANAFTRPLRMLFKCPIALAMCSHISLMYAYVYTLFTIFPQVFETQYHFSVGLGGLAYIAVGIGDILGAFTVGRLNDKIVSRRMAQHQGQRSPEDRLIMMMIIVPAVPIGLLWFGWAAQEHTHWIVPELGAVLIGLGSVSSSICAQVYMIDVFTKFAASAMAASTFERSIAAALIPLAGVPLWRGLGIGLASTTLACISVLSLITSILLFYYGGHLRARYPFEREVQDK